MRARKYIALTLLVSLSGFAQAQPTNTGGRHSAEAALSNDTLQLRYVGRGETVDVEGSTISAAFFLSEERDIVLSADMLFPANVRLGPATILFGPRAYAALLEEENNDVMSFSVGTEIRVDLNRRSGLALVGHAFYGPDILTFGSADSLTDLSARAEIRVAPRLTAFGGMRWFEFDLTEGGGERTLQEELFAGFGWRF